MNLSTILNFEGHDLAFIEREDGELLLRASDLAEPMEVKPEAIRRRLSSLDDEDKGVISIHTPGGPQNVTFLTRSGALQVMATGRSKKCARLRKVICDFFVDYNDGKLGGGVDAQIMTALNTLARVVERQDQRLDRLEILMEKAIEAPRMIARPQVHQTRKYGPEELHWWSEEQECKLAKDGFFTSSAFLLRETGINQPSGKKSGLTTKTVNICKRKGWEVKRYARGSKVITYLPRPALILAYEGRETGQLLLLEGGKS